MNIDNLFKTTDLSELKQEINLLLSDGATVNTIIKALLKRAIPIVRSDDLNDVEYKDFAKQISTSEVKTSNVISVRAELSTKADDTFATVGSDNVIYFRNPITVAKVYEYSDDYHNLNTKPLEQYVTAHETLNECIGEVTLYLAIEFNNVINFILNYQDDI